MRSTYAAIRRLRIAIDHGDWRRDCGGAATVVVPVVAALSRQQSLLTAAHKLLNLPFRLIKIVGRDCGGIDAVVSERSIFRKVDGGLIPARVNNGSGPR